MRVEVEHLLTQDYAEVMRRSLHPRSRVFRGLLALALLAWTALSLDAFAHPLAMAGEMGTHATMAMGKTAAAHCEGMTTMSHTSHALHPAPSHPAGEGHGCCANDGCHCASLCNGMVTVPCLDVTVQPAHDPALVPAPVAPAPVHAAPPLRPPIA